MSKNKYRHTQPVFISSTFRDMHAERDMLRDHPQIKRLEDELRKSKLELEIIDLRWGVETGSLSDYEKKEHRVLKVCLDEIDRCKPFMIVLLGDRYGYIPEHDRIASVATEKGYIIDGCPDEMSVTALEIEYGILANTEQKQRSFFYFRDMDYENIPYSLQSEYSDEKKSMYSRIITSDPEKAKIEGLKAAKSYQRLVALKKKICEVVPDDRIREYKVSWRYTEEYGYIMTGLCELAEMIRQDILKELKSELEETEYKDMTVDDLYTDTLDDFIYDRSRNFEGREELLDLLTWQVLNNDTDNNINVVVGPTGSGKSSIFAYLYNKLSKQFFSFGEKLFLLAHSCGIAQGSVRTIDILKRWNNSLAFELGITDHLKKEPDDILLNNKRTYDRLSLDDNIIAFKGLLNAICKIKKVVIFLDAPERGEMNEVWRHLLWLPPLLPSNCALLVTGLDGNVTEALKSKGAKFYRVDCLQSDQVKSIAVGIAKRYHKELDYKILDKIVQKCLHNNAVPLYLTMIIESLLLLDKDDYSMLYKEDYKKYVSEDEKLTQMILNDLSLMPDGIEELFLFLINKYSERFKCGWLSSLMEYIAISGYGLRETDLAGVFESFGTIWVTEEFAYARRLLRAHLVQLGDEGQWDYTHNFFRLAVIKTMSDDRKKSIHEQLAGVFLKKLVSDLSFKEPIDTFASSQVMFHMYHADMKKEAADYLVKCHMNNVLLSDSVDVIATELEKDVAEHDEHMLNWLDGLLTEPTLSEEHYIIICNVLDKPLMERIKYSVSQKSIGHILHTINDKLRTLDFNNKCVKEEMATNNLLLGDWYDSVQNKKTAGYFYKKAYETIYDLALTFYDIPEYRMNVSTCLDKIGLWYQSQNDFNTTGELFEEALNIARVLAGAYPENIYFKDILNVSLHRMGDWCFLQQDINSALALYEDSLETVKLLADLYPDNFEYKRDTGISFDNLGECHFENNDVETAETFFKKAMDIRESMADRHPDNAEYKRDLSVSFDRMADCKQCKHQIEEEKVYRNKSLKIRKNLADKSPDIPRYKREVAVCLMKYGDMCKRRKDTQLAMYNYNEALIIVMELSEIYTENPEYIRDENTVLTLLGECYHIQENFYKAKECFEKAQVNMTVLSERYPQISEYIRDVALNSFKLGKLLENINDLEAKKNYEKAVKIYYNLLEQYPYSKVYEHDLKECLLSLGYLCMKDDPVSGLKYLKEAISY